MKPHLFRPDPDTPAWCVCGLPRANQTAHVAPPSVPDISEQRPSSLDRVEAPAQTHSPTSVQAALAVGPRLGQMQQTVLNEYVAAGIRGLTDDELVRRLGPDNGNSTGNTIRPRRRELLDAGLVAPLLDNHGRQVTRQTKTGRLAGVWVATPAGRERAA